MTEPPGLSRVLITADELAARVRALGGEIDRDYQDRIPVLVGVLKGAVVFLADPEALTALEDLLSPPKGTSDT